MDSERFGSVVHRSGELRNSVDKLWDELAAAPTRRSLLVVGFSSIVRQHTAAQWLLVQSNLDVSATTLVRPTYESLVRAVWCLDGADDEWIGKFLAPNPEAINSDAETEMGPSVPKMLPVIKQRHPPHVYQPLVALKESTYRAMHSYVHGGIRPVVQSLSEFPVNEATSLVINSNTMLLMATNAARMACGFQSPLITVICKQYADCFPPAPRISANP